MSLVVLIEAIATIERLAEQQAMPDPFWVATRAKLAAEILRRTEAAKDPIIGALWAMSDAFENPSVKKTLRDAAEVLFARKRVNSSMRRLVDLIEKLKSSPLQSDYVPPAVQEAAASVVLAIGMDDEL